MSSSTLIIGCGYIGLPLAVQLKAAGHEIDAWVHSAESATSLEGRGFARIITGNVADGSVWATIHKTYDLIVHCASSGGGGETAYEEVYVQGAHLMTRLQPCGRKVFVSSTSVYGQTKGEIVTEESDAKPDSATGKILRRAEQIALSGGATVVRSAGIYGPKRGVLFEKFRRGEAVIDGDGHRWINQIHQRDLVAALLLLITSDNAGGIYNATDNTPVQQREYYKWCSLFLSLPMPPHGRAEPNRKRGVTNKRVSNAKLRALGWKPVYPNFRDGLAADHSPR